MRFISLEPGRYNGKAFVRAGAKGDIGVFETDDKQVIEMLKNTPWFKKGVIRVAESDKSPNREFLELRQKAKQLGIKGCNKMKKDELRNAINDASKPAE